MQKQGNWIAVLPLRRVHAAPAWRSEENAQGFVCDVWTYTITIAL